MGCINRKTIFIFLAAILTTISSHHSAYAEKVIMGYFPFWALYRDGKTLSDIDTRQLTHLIYSTAILDEKGNVNKADSFSDTQKQLVFHDGTRVNGNYEAVPVLKRFHPNLKTLLSISGWGDSNNYSDVLADPEKRARFYQTALKLKNDYKFDGFEFDWRFPITGGYEQNSKRPDDLVNFKLFLSEFRALCADCVLAATLSEQPHNRPGWNYPEIATYIDYFHLMSAAFHGTWGTRTGHRAPLFVDPAHPLLNISNVVDELLEQGLPSEKLIIRVTSEALGWENVPSENNGLYQVFEGVSLGTWDDQVSGPTGLIAYREIISKIGSPDFINTWDDASKVHSLYNSKTKQFISYESEQSLKYKLNFINSKNLGGIAFWELNSDADGDKALLSIIYSYFNGWDATYYQIKTWVIIFLPWFILAISIWLLTLAGVKWSSKKRKAKKELSTHKKISFALKALPEHLDQIIYLSMSPPDSLRDKMQPDQLMALEKLTEKSVMARSAFAPLTRTSKPPRVIELGSDQKQTNDAATIESESEHIVSRGHVASSEHIASEEPPVVDATTDEALLSLERFTHLISDTNNLEKMMETMFTFISSDFRVKGITLWNEDDLVEQQGTEQVLSEFTRQQQTLQLSDDRVKALISNPEMSGYQITLEFQTPLTPSEEAYFRGLGNQVIFARQQFRELAKQPQLLLELYEIARRKDKLLYIKGEKGYSGIHAEDLKSPLFVFSRLRALRMYFPELLVQVHRSYLINPNSVTRAVKKDSGFHLDLKGHSVPIARSFLAKIKGDYPAWFE